MARKSTDRRPSSVLSWVPLLAFLGVAFWYVLQRSPEVAPGRVDLSRLSARRAQSAISLNGIAGGALAGVKELSALGKTARPVDRSYTQLSAATAYCAEPIPDFDPVRDILRDDGLGAAPPAIRIVGIQSSRPYSDRRDAEDDAAAIARERLATVFAALRSPIRDVPGELDLLREYVRPEDSTNREPTPAEVQAWASEKLDTNRVWKVVTVTVTEQQLRDLRAKQRLRDLARWAVVVLVVLAIGYGVLRADDRSQGYFTWLWMFVGLVLAGGVVSLGFLL